MKKKYLYTVLALSGLLLNTACSLDETPENALTYANSFNTETELNATATSINYYINTAIKDDPVFDTAGSLADELSDNESVREWNPVSVVNAQQDWNDIYNIIYESNLLLDNIYRTKDLSRERYNYYSGQAHFALGLAYLVLTQRYGDVIITKDSKTFTAYGLSPQAEVIDTAIAHARRAYDLLPLSRDLKDLNGNAITDKQIASRGTCAALLAQLYAWKGSMIDLYGLSGNAREAYSQAINYCGELIDGKVGDYSLFSSPEELCEAFSNREGGNEEAIFTITFDKNCTAYTVSPNTPALEYTGWPVNYTTTLGDLAFSTSARLYASHVNDMYEEGDGRRTAFFYEADTPHEVDGIDYAIPYKFRAGVFDPDQSAPAGVTFRTIDADYVYWRLADFYLLRAECLAKTGAEDAAISDLNVIRSRAGASAYPAEKDNEGLKMAIFREREKEFICENDARYFDIIRNGLYRTELRGKFTSLSRQDVLNGALVLPVPEGAFKDKNLHVVNTLIRQKTYWIPYM